LSQLTAWHQSLSWGEVCCGSGFGFIYTSAQCRDCNIGRWYDVAIATAMDIIKGISLGMHQQSSYHHSNNFNNPENFNNQDNRNSYNNRTPTARDSVLVCD